MLFVRNTGEIASTDTGLTGRAGGAGFQVSYTDIASVHEHQGRIWSQLTLNLTGNRTVIRIGGLRKKAATTLRACILEQSLRGVLQQTYDALRELLQSDHYVTHCEWQIWTHNHAAIRDQIPEHADKLPFTAEFGRTLQRVLAAFTSGEALRTARNRHFTTQELTRHRDWFDRLERYPLTERQRVAIICDEDNTLVVAGAGTGKTSTIVGKVGYLLRNNRAHPEEILLLAFARKARDEMAERIAQKFHTPVETRTFHSLGLDILATADGSKPSLSRLAEDKEQFRTAISGYLADAFHDPTYQQTLRRFFLQYRYPSRSEFDCHTAHEHCQYLKGQGLRTIRGERVKSFGELRIADFLTGHGIDYQYEAPYQIDTSTRRYRQYKPDFYLPEHKIYIEYFGINGQGQTAPYINNREYRKGMDWKRDTHQKNGTILLELYFYDLAEERLESRLHQQLRDKGVPVEPVTGPKLCSVLNDAGELTRAAGLFGSFLGLYKANHWSLEEIRRRAAHSHDPARSTAFLGVFETVLRSYTDTLAAAGEIDFHDMIAQATAAVQAGRYQSTFRYIIVDEFQDISRGRARLLQALLAQQPDRRLFCVGDDWQSIYRFTGSDVAIMTQFHEHFGYTQRQDLNQAFRFNQAILDVSSRFIQTNPQQLRKELTANRAVGSPAVTIIAESSGQPPGTGLDRALAQIQNLQQGTPASVLLLGRYRFSLPVDMAAIQRRFHPLELEARTVHSAKGLEADYVIMLDVTTGRYGFPTEMADDPVLNLVLAAGGDFPNAEERRLFYVALTRARQQVYLITTQAQKSAFVQELQGPPYHNLVARDDSTVQAPCPRCGGGSLVQRQSEHGTFWGCSNFPYCDGKGNTCPHCQTGLLIRNGDKYRCSDKTCREEVEACPRCADGILQQRHSDYGPFLGCSNWSLEDPSCNYKRDLRRRKQ